LQQYTSISLGSFSTAAAVAIEDEEEEEELEIAASSWSQLEGEKFTGRSVAARNSGVDWKACWFRVIQKLAACFRSSVPNQNLKVAETKNVEK
jgi:hypothetical protein